MAARIQCTLAMKPLLDASAVAVFLGISRAAAYRETKKMQHVVIGERSLRVTEAAVESYVGQRTKAGLVPERTTRHALAALPTSHRLHQAHLDSLEQLRLLRHQEAHQPREAQRSLPVAHSREHPVTRVRAHTAAPPNRPTLGRVFVIP